MSWGYEPVEGIFELLLFFPQGTNGTVQLQFGGPRHFSGEIIEHGKYKNPLKCYFNDLM